MELTRRQKVLIWDDEVEIAEKDDSTNALLSPTIIATNLSDNRRRSISERRVRSHSFGSFPFPPPLRRSTTDSEAGPGSRPVPFAGKFQKINPGASGVRVLEHMERLDEVERGLKKLGMEETVVDEVEEEQDVGLVPSEQPPAPAVATKKTGDLIDGDLGDGESEHNYEALAASTISAPMLSGYASDEEGEAGDHVSLPDDEGRRETRSLMSHTRATSDDARHRGFEWSRFRRARQEPGAKTRTVIAEVRVICLCTLDLTDL